MTIKSIQGDENINEALNASKWAVINAMIKENIITKEQGEDFGNTHFTILAEKKGFFRSLFSKDDKNSSVIAVKVIS